MISLSAKGLTHGEIFAHLQEIYGAEVSKQTITAITDRVMGCSPSWFSAYRVGPCAFSRVRIPVDRDR